MQVTIMDKILKKEKHASHFGRENQASDLPLFALLCFSMQRCVGEGNGRGLAACGIGKCIQYLSVNYTQVIIFDPALRVTITYLSLL